MLGKDHACIIGYMSEHGRDLHTFQELLGDALDDESFARPVERQLHIMAIQEDEHLEFLLRVFLSSEGPALDEACEQLADYTAIVLEQTKELYPKFCDDDMQVAIEGMRARIEGYPQGAAHA